MLKNENENELAIEMVLHAKHYSLALDKNKCTGCGVCMEICPREAIQVTRTPKAKGEKAKKPTVGVNEEKCHYCGMCEAVCPFGALKLKVNGKTVIPVVKTESFPQLIREIKIDESKCGLECLDIKEACPLDHIKVSVCNADGKMITGATSKIKKKLKVKVEVDKESCPCCRFCETKFPDGAISVEKMFYGRLAINSEKCPEGCHDCVDVCPIPDVLCIKEGKVQVNDSHCVYCGACKIACPEEGALELNRTRIRHTEVHSGAWNKALEKLASTNAVIKEMENKNAQKLKKVILKRLPPEELDT
ncbi:MAG: 4Fe-4S binding protein [Candidatus Bathyarchaeota archaeon]|nr:4Fe-4S binding protein [Candidatus Bathyarchaeum sp.]